MPAFPCPVRGVKRKSSDSDKPTDLSEHQREPKIVVWENGHRANVKRPIIDLSGYDIGDSTDQFEKAPMLTDTSGKIQRIRPCDYGSNDEYEGCSAQGVSGYDSSSSDWSSSSDSAARNRLRTRYQKQRPAIDAIGNSDDLSSSAMPSSLNSGRAMRQRRRSSARPLDGRAAISESGNTQHKRSIAPCKYLPKRVTRYEPHEEEVAECPELEIIGEECAKDQGAVFDDDDIPCRCLDDFTFFDVTEGKNKYKLESMEEIGAEGKDVVCAGWVRAMRSWELDGGQSNDYNGDDDYDDDDDDDDTDADGEAGLNTGPGSSAAPTNASVKGKEPARANANQTGTGTKGTQGRLQRIRLSSILYYQPYISPTGEPEMWVRTSFAYYKLGHPAKHYEHLYSRTHRPFYLAVKFIA
ncbi:hypothetical protein EV182_004954, partial [Spiromyces aspiralis]